MKWIVRLVFAQRVQNGWRSCCVTHTHFIRYRAYSTISSGGCFLTHTMFLLLVISDANATSCLFDLEDLVTIFQNHFFI